MQFRRDWDEAEITKLRNHWEAGMSASLIGKAMGCSKGSIVGKAARIGLTPRPCPIGVRKTVPVTPTRGFVPGVRVYPPLVKKVARPAPVAPPVIAAPRHYTVAPRLCHWVTDDTRRHQTYCDAPCIGRASFCPEHHGICFTQSKFRHGVSA